MFNHLESLIKMLDPKEAMSLP